MGLRYSLITAVVVMGFSLWLLVAVDERPDISGSLDEVETLSAQQDGFSGLDRSSYFMQDDVENVSAQQDGFLSLDRSFRFGYVNVGPVSTQQSIYFGHYSRFVHDDALVQANEADSVFPLQSKAATHPKFFM